MSHRERPTVPAPVNPELQTFEAEIAALGESQARLRNLTRVAAWLIGDDGGSGEDAESQLSAA